MLMRIRVLVLLIILYFIYMIIGAVIFMVMERPAEKQRCRDAKQFKEKWLNQTRKNEGFTEETLNKFIKNVTRFSGYGISLQGNVKCPANWDFQSSLFFTGTIITTIGYGNLAPTLWYSQIFCIFYALFGIPLFAIMFTGIGEYMAVLAGELLKKFKKNAPEEDLRIINAFFSFALIVGGSFIFFQLIPAAIFTFVEGWSYRESVYYCFITLTTVGFGDYVAGTNPEVQYIALYRVMVLFWILFGLAYTFTAIDLIIHSMKAAVAKSKFVDFILYNWAEAEVSLHSEVESLLGESSSGKEDIADDIFSSPEFRMFRTPGDDLSVENGSNIDDGGPGSSDGSGSAFIDPPSFINTHTDSRENNAAVIDEITGGPINTSSSGIRNTNIASSAPRSGVMPPDDMLLNPPSVINSDTRENRLAIMHEILGGTTNDSTVTTNIGSNTTSTNLHANTHVVDSETAFSTTSGVVTNISSNNDMIRGDLSTRTEVNGSGSVDVGSLANLHTGASNTGTNSNNTGSGSAREAGITRLSNATAPGAIHISPVSNIGVSGESGSMSTPSATNVTNINTGRPITATTVGSSTFGVDSVPTASSDLVADAATTGTTGPAVNLNPSIPVTNSSGGFTNALSSVLGSAGAGDVGEVIGPATSSASNIGANEIGD